MLPALKPPPTFVSVEKAPGIPVPNDVDEPYLKAGGVSWALVVSCAETLELEDDMEPETPAVPVETPTGTPAETPVEKPPELPPERPVEDPAPTTPAETPVEDPPEIAPPIETPNQTPAPPAPLA